jgi:hypothetical protein
MRKGDEPIMVQHLKLIAVRLIWLLPSYFEKHRK